MKDTFNIYLKLLLRVSPALSTSDYRSFSETWCPGTSENQTSFPNTVWEKQAGWKLHPHNPLHVHFHIFKPLSYVFEKQESKGGQCKTVQMAVWCLLNRVSQNESRKPSVQRQVSEDQFWKSAKREWRRDPWCFGWDIKWGTAPQCFFDIRGLSEARGILVLLGWLFYPLQNMIWKRPQCWNFW